MTEPEMPKADFLTLVASLAGQATISMGLVEHPLKKQVTKDLRAARYAIDLVAVLETKTRGNLTDEEKRVLERVLADLRVRFVEASK
jgi:hypothetical protein